MTPHYQNGYQTELTHRPKQPSANGHAPNLALVRYHPVRAPGAFTDTITFTAAEAAGWVLASMQRPVGRNLDKNKKVKLITAELKANGGFLPGVLHFSFLPNDPTPYLTDGQQRREAFGLSGLAEGMAVVRYHDCADRAAQSVLYIALQEQIVRVTADDKLKALAEQEPIIRAIRERFPFIHYHSSRGKAMRVMASMSVVLRAWCLSASATPGWHARGVNELVASMPDGEGAHLLEFLTQAKRAWGLDPEYSQLWNFLNLNLSMWLYRRVVVAEVQPGRKTAKLTPHQFGDCLMALSGHQDYLKWLIGRTKAYSDRSPCYTRMKTLLADRWAALSGKRAMFPQPEWSGR